MCLLCARRCGTEQSRRAAPPSGTGTQWGADTQNVKLCHHLCAKSPSKTHPGVQREGEFQDTEDRGGDRAPCLSVPPCMGVQRPLPVSQSCKDVTEDVPRSPPATLTPAARNCTVTQASSDVCALIYDTVCTSERRKQGPRSNPRRLIGLIISEDKQLTFSQGCTSGVFSRPPLGFCSSLLSGSGKTGRERCMVTGRHPVQTAASGVSALILGCPPGEQLAAADQPRTGCASLMGAERQVALFSTKESRCKAVCTARYILCKKKKKKKEGE